MIIPNPDPVFQTLEYIIAISITIAIVCIIFLSIGFLLCLAKERHTIFEYNKYQELAKDRYSDLMHYQKKLDGLKQEIKAFEERKASVCG